MKGEVDWQQLKMGGVGGEVQLQLRTSDDDDVDPLLKKERGSSVGSLPEIVKVEGRYHAGEEVDYLEVGSFPCCRICLESDCDPEDELISPCMCKGTQQFVHRLCLDSGRRVCFLALHHLQRHNFICVALLEDSTWRKMKFRLFVARDVFFIFLVAQTVISAIAEFVDGQRWGSGTLSMMDGTAYCLNIRFCSATV
ncbi:hypothetical protein MLD38_014812 [Melastoma candidum]|uniref:Uncharacterized protein n=1 Tax=Melastoma candidum TaxID=119954 RepID=A0ACB9RE27_9MYRT|nr:hypothetical protein MLD38_014812 [Melastoma candidum]